MPTNNEPRGMPGIDWQDTHSDPRSGLPMSPAPPLGAGGIPPPTPLLSPAPEGYAQALVAATLAGETLPSVTTPQEVRELYLSHSLDWPGADGPLEQYEPYQPPIPEQASDIYGLPLRPDRNR